FGKLGWLGGLFGISLGGTGSRPVSNKPDLLVCQAQIAGKLAMPFVGQPGRHVALPGDCGDLVGVLPNLFITQEGKRSRPAGVVAWRAPYIKDGRNVAGERGSCPCRGDEGQGNPCRRQERRAHAVVVNPVADATVAIRKLHIFTLIYT